MDTVSFNEYIERPREITLEELLEEEIERPMDEPSMPNVTYDETKEIIWKANY